ncbi:uncharacterized protein LOC143296335 [Babylonia areolata]|uniref:uncharacterized protein LOC143296335 n=1 Tax=Babylonia areolata TaxID=304850 RepID=UPI003FCF56DF
MDIPFHVDLPPVPGCFSKLLSSESESSASELPNQPWREAERLRELKNIILKSLEQEAKPEASVVNGERDVSETTLVDVKDGSKEIELQSEGCGAEDAGRTFLPIDQSHLQQTGTSASPFNRLNIALGRLKREMVNLRHLDMSLFCQLLSLNEAIQDFKMSIGDRCSDYTGSEYTCSEYTGSEYSFGEGMGSRAGSFSSLNDEHDWSRDFRDPNSPLGLGEGAEERTSADELAASTSSFLQQIKNLTMRVETDF